MGACEMKRQAKLAHWRTQIIDCRSSGMSVKDGVRNTIYRQRPTTAGKRKSLSSAATELMSATSVPQHRYFAELPSPLERQTMGGVVVSIQIGKVKSDIYSGEEVRTRL